jgi:CHASE3 domain sensor protein
MDQFNALYETLQREVLYPAIALAFAVAVLYFLWGVYRYIRNADNADERANGHRQMFYGIIGLAIMSSAAVLVNLIKITIEGLGK